MASQILDKKWCGGLYHLYATDDTWKNWIEEFEPSYQYPSDFKEKIEKLFKNNLSYIENKNVVDLACNLGYLSLAASNLGATKVLGIEIRQEYIDTFNRVYEHWPKKNIVVKSGNLEILNNYQDWLSDIDTIFYTGHFYHTIKHTPILEAFTNSPASCLILESIINKNSEQEKLESIDDPLNGYIDEDTKFVPVRAPTVEETSSMLIELGWSITSICFIEQYNPRRFIITATRGK